MESLSTLPGGQVTTIYSDTTAGVGPTATTTAAGILGSIEPGPSIATTGPVATFTGEAILEGSCTVPRYASVTMGTGQGEVYLEYPWLGCSLEEPDCCPFDSKVGGQLSVCPSDYFTTSGACCPSYDPVPAISVL